MPQNFLACDRGQTMLLPPDLTEWVPDDHVVWSILGAVDQVDLSAFYGAYRANGQGRAAYEPSMMVALLIYSYARGNRSSRGIERACREDVTYKLITAMAIPELPGGVRTDAHGYRRSGPPSGRASTTTAVSRKSNPVVTCSF